MTELSEPRDEVDLGWGWRDTSVKASGAVSLWHPRVSSAFTTGLTPSCLGTANSSSVNPILCYFWPTLTDGPNCLGQQLLPQQPPQQALPQEQHPKNHRYSPGCQRPGEESVSSLPLCDLASAASQNMMWLWSCSTTLGIFSLSRTKDQVAQAWECTSGQRALQAAGSSHPGPLQKGCGWGKGPILAWSLTSLLPQGLFRIFSSRTKCQQPGTQLMFSLTSLPCLQRAAASQGSLALRHFALQSSQRPTEQRGYSSSSAPVLAFLQSWEAAPGVPSAGPARNTGVLAPNLGQSSQEAQPAPEIHQMHHVCHPQLPNSTKSSDFPSKSPVLLQNRGIGQGTSYSLLCSVTQTWEHKPSWHHRDVLAGSHIGLFHIPKGASTSGNHTHWFFRSVTEMDHEQLRTFPSW